MLKSISLALLTVVLIPPSIATADPKQADSGFWCWTHPDGESALCARKQEHCEASRYGFNEVARSLHEQQITAECQWQKTAWELVTKRPRGPGHHYPTKKLCAKALDKGESCRLAR